MAFGVNGGFYQGILKMSHSTVLWQSIITGLSEENKSSTSTLFAKQLELQFPGKPAGVKGNTGN